MLVLNDYKEVMRVRVWMWMCASACVHVSTSVTCKSDMALCIRIDTGMYA